MLLISHRGSWWPDRRRQNHPASVLNAFAAGFGAEVDVCGLRDGALLLSHNGGSPVCRFPLTPGGPSAEGAGPLMLHLKRVEDTARFVDMLRTEGWLPHVYVFCSPSNDGLLAEAKALTMQSARDARLQTLTTVTDLEGLDVLLDQPDPLGGADGVWLEQPDGDWVHPEVIYRIQEAGKTAWVVSPELHGRKLNLGMLMGAWQSADGLVTDYPHLVKRVLDRTDPAVHPKEPWWD